MERPCSDPYRAKLLLLLERQGISDALGNNESLKERLLGTLDGLLHSIVRRYNSSKESREELMQVARIGASLAIDRFDPSLGFQLSTYVSITAVGEIKRHFRDTTWAVCIPRRTREQCIKVQKAKDRLESALGCEPTRSEIAREVNLPVEEVAELLATLDVCRPASLESDIAHLKTEKLQIIDCLGKVDPALERVEERALIRQALDKLTAQQRTVLEHRYFGQMSQAEIGIRIGVGQTHVSRIERLALARLRAELAETWQGST